MDPGDVSHGLAFGDSVEDRHERTDTAPSRDENYWNTAWYCGIDEEFPGWMGALDLVAGLDAVDKHGGEHAGLMAGTVWLNFLDCDPVVVSCPWQVGHGVLPYLVVANLRYEQPDADILKKKKKK